MKIIEYREDKRIRKDVEPLFVSAFPEDERPPEDIFFQSFDKECNRLFAFYEEEKFIGFDSVIIFQDICYIFFLAVSPKCRSQGYGSIILSIMKEMFEDFTILLCYEEVDKKYEDYDNRLRRSLFYKNNGFILNPLKTNEYGVTFQTVRFGPKVVTFNDYQKIFEIGFGEYSLKFLREEKS